MDQSQLELAVEALDAFIDYANFRKMITMDREDPALILLSDYSGRVYDPKKDILYFEFRDFKDLMIRSLMVTISSQMDAETPLLHYDEDGNEFFFSEDADPDEGSTPHVSWELFCRAIDNFKKMHSASYKGAVRKSLLLETWNRDELGKVFYSL